LLLINVTLADCA